MKNKTYTVRGNKQLGRALYAAQLTQNINRQLKELHDAIVDVTEVQENYDSIVENMEAMCIQVGIQVGDALVDYR